MKHRSQMPGGWSTLAGLASLTIIGGGLVLLLGILATWWDSNCVAALTAVGPVVSGALLAGLIGVTWWYASSTQHIAQATRLQIMAQSEPMVLPNPQIRLIWVDCRIGDVSNECGKRPCRELGNNSNGGRL